MKIDLTLPIIGLNGKTMDSTRDVFLVQKNKAGEYEFEKDANGNEIILTIETPDKALTIKQVLIISLLANPKKEIPIEEKAKRYSLFSRIEMSKTDKIDLTAEETSLCKKLVNDYYSILPAGRACDILENK